MVARSAPVLVRMPTHLPSSPTTGASLCRPAWSSPNACSGSTPAGSVRSPADITCRSWVNRSTPVQSASVTTPTGRPSAMTTDAAVRALEQQVERMPGRRLWAERQRCVIDQIAALDPGDNLGDDVDGYVLWQH